MGSNPIEITPSSPVANSKRSCQKYLTRPLLYINKVCLCLLLTKGHSSPSPAIVYCVLKYSVWGTAETASSHT